MASGEARARSSGAVAAPRPGFSAYWLRGLTEWVLAGLAQEHDQRRLFPWLAVAFGAGVLVYFTATAGEPVMAAPLGLAILLCVVLPFCAARPVARALLLEIGRAHV